jgi:hypothetical protein
MKWIFWLAVLSLLYLLSAGPVGYFNIKRHWGLNSSSPLSRLYAPAAWVGKNTPLGEPLKAYEQWWLAMAQRPAPTP